MVNTNAVEVDCLANSDGLDNTTFVARWQTGDVRSAVDLLVDTERASSAALLARSYARSYAQSYAQSRVAKAFNAWRRELEKKGRAKVGALIGDPLRGEERELFEEAGRTHFRETNRVHILIATRYHSFMLSDPRV